MQKAVSSVSVYSNFYIDKLYRSRKQRFYYFYFILHTELKSFCHRGPVLFFTIENGTFNKSMVYSL